jgi:NADH dehydrogenase
MKTACVFGGTGFIGRYIVQKLAQQGYIIKVPSRSPQKGDFLIPYGDADQILPVFCDGSDPSLHTHINGCNIVINCIGILYQSRHSTFKQIHTDIPQKIAQICHSESVSNFVHLSALGCDKAQSKYAQSKLAGEHAILDIYPTATILRPSIVFGAEDNFFNLFKKFPILPLIGGGKTKFQPIYVGDLADAVIASIKIKKTGIIECGGASVFSFKELLQKLNDVTQCQRPMVCLPYKMAYVQAFFLGLLPRPLLTVDQVKSLKTDNVVSNDHPTILNLGIEPTVLETVLPQYCGKND